MTKRSPAEVFPPGEFLRDELDARGWTQVDFAMILGRNERDVNDIINAKRSVTPRTAKELAEALGTSATFWLNLQSQYDLYTTELAEEPGAVAKRAELFGKAPLNKMIQRGWIETSENVEVLERRLLDFFEIDALSQTPRVWGHAARKKGPYSEVTAFQWAWLCRARQLARAVQANRHTEARFRGCLDELRLCLHDPEEIRRVPEILAAGGVRLVLVEPLPGSKIDGACFWLNKWSPVVAISLRYDRIDWWWFTLMHELGHVRNRDGLKGNETPLDIDILAGAKDENAPGYEREANRFATTYLVNQEELGDFIVRVRPLYSKKKIRLFAKRIGVHPGIVVGQLQFLDEIPYSHSRDLLVKIKRFATSAALTDGWGHRPVAMA